MNDVGPMTRSNDARRERDGSASEPVAEDSRRAVLGRIAAALAPERGGERRPVTLADRPAAVTERLGDTRRRTLPRVDGDLEARLVENMEAVLMSVVRLQRPEDVPGAVAFWLESEGIGGDVTVAPALGDLDWPSGDEAGGDETGDETGDGERTAGGGRRWRVGAASGDETVSVTPCLAAVAETGSVALASGARTPATLAFLPENHVVVLRADDIVAHVEDVFPRLRALEALPRALNSVTGPSRTADIEQTIEIGAHGPRRMHVLIVPGATGAVGTPA